MPAYDTDPVMPSRRAFLRFMGGAPIPRQLYPPAARRQLDATNSSLATALRQDQGRIAASRNAYYRPTAAMMFQSAPDRPAGQMFRSRGVADPNLPRAENMSNLGARNYNSMTGGASPDVQQANDEAVARQQRAMAQPFLGMSNSPQANQARRMLALRRPSEPESEPSMAIVHGTPGTRGYARISTPGASEPDITIQRPAGGPNRLNVLRAPVVTDENRDRQIAAAQRRQDRINQGRAFRAARQATMAQNPVAIAQALGMHPSQVAQMQYLNAQDLANRHAAYQTALGKGEIKPDTTFDQFTGGFGGSPFGAAPQPQFVPYVNPRIAMLRARQPQGWLQRFVNNHSAMNAALMGQ